MKKALTISIFIGLLGLLIYTFVDGTSYKTAPTITLKTFDGELRQIGGDQSKIVFLNFWASWCGPCEDEAADLVKLQKKYGGQVDFIGVNATNVDTRDDAYAFILKHDIQYEIVLDTDGVATEQYKVIGYPMSFILNKDGEIAETIKGVRSYEEFEKLIKKHL